MQYHTPSSFSEAVTISNSADGLVKYLAGGTDVLVQLKIGTNSPDHLIDIKKIPGVKEIALRKTEDGQLAQQFLAYNLLIIKSYQGNGLV